MRRRRACRSAHARLCLLLVSVPARAQQASQPAFDVRQTERRFDDGAVRKQTPGGGRRCAMPRVGAVRDAGGSDAAVRAARRLDNRRARDPARPARRRLATLSSARRSRRPTSPRSPPASATSTAPPAFTSAAPSCRRRTSRTAGPHPGDRRQHHRRRAEGRGRRAVRRPRRCSIRCSPSSRRGWPTLERQLLLINTRPGVRIVDTALEEIGTASGHFRLVVSLKTWHVYAFARPRQSRFVRGRPVAELCDRRVQFL